jgi:hypothetical protein
LIEAKLAGQAVSPRETPRAILPLLEALQQSVGAQTSNDGAPRSKEKTPSTVSAKERTSRKRARRTA